MHSFWVVMILLLAAAAPFRVEAAAPSRNLQKTRPGSMLKSERPWETPGDLRGEAEQRRDRELATHVQRIAELDVLANVASSASDLGLEERVEQVRRKELQRHQRVMMQLSRASRRALLTGARP